MADSRQQVPNLSIGGGHLNEKSPLKARNAESLPASPVKNSEKTMITKENKMLRFKITDFTSQQQIQNVLIKLWRIITQL